jgi:hypothetical protein
MHLNNLSEYQKYVYHIAWNMFSFASLNITLLRIAKGEKKGYFPPGGCECNQEFNDLSS